MKQEFEERGANAANLAKIKTNTEMSDSKKFSGTVAPLYQPGQIGEMMEGQARGTLSLLSNKPLRVGSHCIQNKMAEQSKSSLQAPAQGGSNSIVHQSNSCMNIPES